MIENMRKIIILTGLHTKRNLWNKKNILVLLMLFYFIGLFTVPLLQIAEDYHVGISPYILPVFCESYTSVVALLLGFILLVSGIPDRDQHQLNLILRSNYKIWTISQLIYTVVAAFVYLCCIHLISILEIIVRMGFTGKWGSILEALADNYEMMEQYNMMFATHSSAVLENFTPLRAEFTVSVALFFVFLLLGLLILTLNVLSNGYLGTVAAVMFVFAGMTMQEFHAYFPDREIFKYNLTGWLDLNNYITEAEPVKLGNVIGSTLLMAVVLVVILLIAVKYKEIRLKGKGD